LTDPVIGREGDRVGEAYEYTPVGHETFNTAEVLRRRPDAIVFLQPAARSIVEQPTVVVGTPAEKELLEAIVRQKHDYVAVSREFLGGAHVVMLLRGGVADSIMPAQQVEPSSLEIDYRTPDDPYPNLP
jgi:NifB/MoaA-like Fe-S oxidoreductase